MVALALRAAFLSATDGARFIFVSEVPNRRISMALLKPLCEQRGRRSLPEASTGAATSPSRPRLWCPTSPRTSDRTPALTRVCLQVCARDDYSTPYEGLACTVLYYDPSNFPWAVSITGHLEEFFSLEMLVRGSKYAALPDWWLLSEYPNP